jgi:hypothetical protein
MVETITVTDGTTEEQCEIIETVTHRGDEFAKVEGDELSGFVGVASSRRVDAADSASTDAEEI